MERLICDQFRRCEIGEGDIVAAGGDGSCRLIDAVQLRLDTGKPDGSEVKAIVIKLPDYSAPDVLIRGEEEESGPVSCGHPIITFAPMLPAGQMGVAQKEAEGGTAEAVLQAPLELRPHFKAETIPHKFPQVKRSGFDPLLQADALVQGTGLRGIKVRTVLTLHIPGLIPEAGTVPAMPLWLEIGRGHHQLFRLSQRGIPHKIARHG